MKKLAVIILVLLATATFGQKKITLSITGGELILGKTTSTQTYTYKADQLVFYNLNPDRKINVYFKSPASVITLDTTLIYSYNSSTDTVSCATLITALQGISSGLATSAIQVTTKTSIDSLLRYSRTMFGLNGTITITGTDSTATPRGAVIKALTDAVINKVWYKTGTGKTSLSTYSLSAGNTFEGDILSVDLTSGSVIVYLY